MKCVLTGQMRNAIQTYNMIQDGDSIGVGISGGKDSLCLLLALAELKEYLSISFTLHAFTVDLGFEGQDFSSVESLCKSLDIPYEIIPTQIGKIVFDARKESNPCSLCAKLRRGALNKVAKEKGCNKIALGHSKDDVIETYLMSLFYEGRLYTFSPITYLSKTKLHVIRPLGFSYEKDIRYFNNKRNLKPIPSMCPVDKQTKRHEMRALIRDLSKENKHIRANLFGTIQRNHIGGW